MVVTIYVPALALHNAYGPLPKAFLLREGKSGNSTLQHLSQKNANREKTHRHGLPESSTFRLLSNKEDTNQNDVPLFQCSSVS